MFFKEESIEPINFEGLLIRDFTAKYATDASFAAIEVPSGVGHREAWSKRSHKYYYVISGQLWFMIDGVEQLLSKGCFCLVSQGQRFAYKNRSYESVHLILVHVPSFNLESEVFVDQA